MLTESSAMANSVSRSPATRLLLLLLPLMMLESKLHPAVKKRSSTTVLKISTELRRNRNKDLKKPLVNRTTVQQRNVLELPPTILPLLNVNRNVTRKSAQPNNKETRFTSRSRLRSKGSLMRRNLLRQRFVRSKSRLSKQRKSVSSRTLCS